MAGIGFELRKVVGKGGLGSFLRAAFSGIMIVAGPWLMSIVGIALIQRFISQVAGSDLLFTATIIYSYAWSLVLFSGFHIIYTRIVADLLFVRKEREAAGTLVFFLALIAVLTLALAIPVYSTFSLTLARPWLYRFSAVLLFVAINMVWLLMIFISLLKRYILILVIYAVGIGVSVILSSFFSPALELEGSLLGFACGHALIAILLAVLAFSSISPEHVGKGLSNLVSYAQRFGLLLATGFLYSWAIWVDKVIFWFTEGTLIEGTFFRLYASYDVAVYVANLSMIPGLVYFIIVSETGFYVQLRKFLLTLAKGTLAEIQRRKQRLLSGISWNLWQQALFQSIFSLSLFLLAPILTRLFAPGTVSAATIRIVLTGVFVHFLSLTVMNYHFYLEFFHHALMTAGTFFAVNTVITLLMAFDYIPLIPGVGYAAGGCVSAIYSYIAIQISGKKMDRRILARSSGV